MNTITDIITANELPELARLANAEHAAFERAISGALEHAIRCGEYLEKAKGICGHGNWALWLAKNFSGSTRKAQRYMSFYANRERLQAKTTRAADMSLRQAERLLQSPRPTHRPFSELSAQSREELTRRYWDLLAVRVLIYDAAGWDISTIAGCVRRSEANVQAILCPRLSGVSASAAREALTLLAQHAERAAETSAREGFPEAAPVLRHTAKLYRRRADELHDRGEPETTVADINAARAILHVEPGQVGVAA